MICQAWMSLASTTCQAYCVFVQRCLLPQQEQRHSKSTVCSCIVAGCDDRVDGGRCMSACACLHVHSGQLQHASAWPVHQHLQLSFSGALGSLRQCTPPSGSRCSMAALTESAPPPPAGSQEMRESNAGLPQKGPLKPSGILGSVLPKPVARTVGPKMVKFRSNVQELGFRVS